jgi:hypothetical protein
MNGQELEKHQKSRGKARKRKRGKKLKFFGEEPLA